MSDEVDTVQNLNVPEIDHSKRNGATDDEDDIFKSAMESPMTDSERTLHGDDEIDLNDDDDDIDSSVGVSSSQSGLPPDVNHDINNDFAKNHVGDNHQTNDHSKQDQSKPYEEEPPQNRQGTSEGIGGSKPQIEEDDDVPSDPSQYIKISVTDPQKQGEGMSTFIVYRVTTRTNIALFRRKEFAVWRRFSDFLGLHYKIAEKYLKKGRIVPPAPEKNMIGTTKIKMSGQGENAGPTGTMTQGDFVERRRASLERFLNRVGSNPVLRVDPDFRDFLEIDTDLPKATSTSAFSGAGVVRLFNKVGETVNKISYRMDEADPWFEERIQNIEALENQLRKVHTSIELLVAYRRDLAAATGNFSKSAAILSNAEEHTGLARALAQLSDVEDKVEQMHTDQANSDYYLFSELFRDYISLIGCVKDVFHERVKAYQTLQHAQQTLNKKREAKAKLELQVKTDKLAQAREEVVEWEAKVERSQAEFDSISNVIKKELELFETTRVKEFKKVILKYLESLLTHQQDLLKYWEAFLPEAKAVV
ncbi:unnamed protein product [Orchesella dallaii]|uniref:PX domain-containing protein n=1 Tax=Orchesella dallaii TaxID=48710 RepID=A0ABP1Q3Z5_9HEXA